MRAGKSVIIIFCFFAIIVIAVTITVMVFIIAIIALIKFPKLTPGYSGKIAIKISIQIMHT